MASPVSPRSWTPAPTSATGYQPLPQPVDDDVLVDRERLDASDEEGAGGMERPGLGRGERSGHGIAVLVPELGDAVDIDSRRRDVRPSAAASALPSRPATPLAWLITFE